MFFEFQMLTETLADAEVDIKSLKNIVERKDDELSQSEEQCRHLVRHSEPKLGIPFGNFYGKPRSCIISVFD